MSSIKAIRSVALVFVALAVLPSYAQEDCLEFPSGRGGDMFYEEWDSASKTLDRAMSGETLSASEITAAIASLRKAVTLNKSVGREVHGTTKREFDYHPYLALAVLEAKRGRFQCVGPLLSRDNRNRMPAAYQAQFDTLQQEVIAFDTAKDYRDLAAEVATLAGRGRLSATGQAKAQEISQLGDQLGTSRGSDLGALNAKIARGVTDLGQIEAARVRRHLDDVRTVAANALRNVDVSSCADPGATQDPQQLRAVIQRIDACLASGVKAITAGGAAACATLQQEREAVRQQVDLVRKWGGSASTTPDALPAACANGESWSGTDLDALAQNFTGLAFESTQTAYRTSATRVAQEVTQLRGSFLALLQTEEQKIVVAVQECEGTLTLRGPNSKLRELQKEIRTARNNPNLEPSEKLRGIGSEIASARGQLKARVVSGVEDLLSQKQEMADEGVDTAPFAGLETARQQLGGGEVSANSLVAICNAAQGVDTVLAAWSTKNVPKMKASAQAYRWFLSSAADLADPGQHDCLQTSQAALATPGSNAAWAKSTRSALSEAKACLLDFRETRSVRITAIAARLKGSVSSLAQLEGIESLPQDRLRRMRTELESALTGLDRAQTVLNLPSEAAEADVRAGLHAAGIDAAAASWPRVQSLAPAEKAPGLQTVREEATAGLVAAASRTVEQWSTQIGKLGTFAALDGALTRFGRGDLDRAILELRNWVPDPGSDSQTLALRHATLAYFLHTKWFLLPQDRRERGVGALLYQDARQEIEAAFARDPQLDLPQVLNNDERFQRFVADCCR